MAPVVTGIHIEKFRKFRNCDIKLSAPIVAITGQNGTQKTSLLGMIAHPFSLKSISDPMSKERSVSGRKFGSDIGTKFKFSDEFDKPGDHSWRVCVDEKRWPRNWVNCVSSYRADGTGKWRFSDPSKKKGTGYIQCPCVYLSLKRLSPIGELKAVDRGKVRLGRDETQKFVRWHDEILLMQTEVVSVSTVGSGGKQTAGVRSARCDALTMSAGQDNVGELILAVLSLRRLKKQYPKSYVGGIICIDEIDATMFPASQIKLLEKMVEWAHSFDIQFFFTTHSETMFKAFSWPRFQNHIQRVHLRSVGPEIYIDENPPMSAMLADVNLGYENRRATKIVVYSEDDVTGTFIEELLDDDLKRSLSVLRGASISSTTLRTLFDSGIPEFRENLIVLDGDMKEGPRRILGDELGPYYNFVCLPGSCYPEKVLFSHFAKLSPSDPFWEKVMGGYTKQLCFRDVSAKESDQGQIKKWFKGQDELRSDGKRLLIRKWVIDHPKEKEEFVDRFKTALEKVLAIRN